MLEEGQSSWVAMRDRNSVRANGAGAEGIVTTGSTANRYSAQRGPAQGDAADRATPNSQNEADSAPTEGNDSNCQPSYGNKAPRHAAAGNPPRGSIPNGEDTAGMAAPFASLRVWADGN